jgi:hypothetical protein
VDLIGGTIFFAPFIINNCFSLAAGILGRSNLPLAETFIRLLYVFWFIHCFSLAMAVLFSGFRLVKVLETHMSKFNSSGPRYASVKAGIFKIKALLSIITIALFMFAVFLLLFGILRALILVNTPGSVFLGAVWNFLGPVATVIAECAIIFK